MPISVPLPPSYDASDRNTRFSTISKKGQMYRFRFEGWGQGPQAGAHLQVPFKKYVVSVLATQSRFWQ